MEGQGKESWQAALASATRQTKYKFKKIQASLSQEVPILDRKGNRARDQQKNH